MKEHPVGVVLDQLLDRARQFCFDFFLAVRLEDPGLRLDHLRQRPVADALTVRERPSLPPVRQHAAALDRLEELADQAALADARHANERDQLRRTLLTRASERTDELLQFALAPDERRARFGSEVDAEPRPRLHDLPDWNRRFLPLRLDRRELAVIDRLRRRAIRRLANEDAVHG